MTHLAGIVTSPVPDSETFLAMRFGVLHVEKLQMVLLVGNDYIYVASTVKAVIHRAQETVSIRRQIDPHNLRRLVGNNVEKSRILVSEPVVILTPNSAARCQLLLSTYGA